jgi:hypothetical protein
MVYGTYQIFKHPRLIMQTWNYDAPTDASPVEFVVTAKFRSIAPYETELNVGEEGRRWQEWRLARGGGQAWIAIGCIATTKPGRRD